MQESSTDDENISTEQLYEFRIMDEEDKKLHSLIRSKSNKIFFNPATSKNNTVKYKAKMSDPIPLPQNVAELEEKILNDVESSLGIKKQSPAPPTTPAAPPSAPVPPPPVKNRQKTRNINNNSILESTVQTPQTPPKRVSTETKRAHSYFQRAYENVHLL
jgi:hypothetical protein